MTTITDFSIFDELYKDDITVKIIADSIAQGVRLTTFEIKQPKILLQEFNTHKDLSRNSSSSRAIPTKRLLKELRQYYRRPHVWLKANTGMQSYEQIVDSDQLDDINRIHYGMAMTVLDYCEALYKLNVSKQQINEYLEPFCFTNTLVTATTYNSFITLRDHHTAKLDIQIVARRMKRLLEENKPITIPVGLAHLPYITNEEFHRFEFQQLCYISAARCARISYKPFDGNDSIEKELKRANFLLKNKHMSPFEHQAQHVQDEYYILSNFRRPWLQCRKIIEGSHV